MAGKDHCLERRQAEDKDVAQTGIAITISGVYVITQALHKTPERYV